MQATSTGRQSNGRGKIRALNKKQTKGPVSGAEQVQSHVQQNWQSRRNGHQTYAAEDHVFPPTVYQQVEPDADDESENDAEVPGDFYSNMRIVTPDFLNGDWDMPNQRGAAGWAAGMQPPALGKPYGHGSTIPGSSSQMHVQNGGQLDQDVQKNLRGQRSLPMVLNRQRQGGVPPSVAAARILESEEENRVSFCQEVDVHDTRPTEDNFDPDMFESFCRDSFESQTNTRHSTMTQRPSWADEDPSDTDVGPLYDLEWTGQTNDMGFSSIARVEDFADEDEHAEPIEVGRQHEGHAQETFLSVARVESDEEVPVPHH
jgi:hypothetical protein